MRVAIHQIQFLPGLRFFSKMRDCDVFVFLDDVQYEKREFQNRNKIKTSNGWQYLTVPVKTKGKFNQKIMEVEICNDFPWREEHLKAIKINYSKANYFKNYFGEIERIYSKDYVFLKDISLEFIYFFIKELKLKRKMYFSSEFNLASTSSQRLVDICKFLKANEYLSGAGARVYLDEKIFIENGIKVLWQDFKIKEYPQINGKFIENLSLLDLLLNCGKGSISYL